PSLPISATVIINSGATLKLDFSGTNPVDGLMIGGVPMPAGVYNSSNTPQITGTGSLQIGGLVARNLVWDNGAGTGNWNTNDANWSSGLTTGLTWDNTRPDNAVFKSNGGDITLAEPIKAGSITFGSTAGNCPRSSFNGGSLQANSLTVQGSSGNGPSTTVNRLEVNVPTVSIAGDVAVGRGNLAIIDGNFAAGRIISAPDSADWATVTISGGTVTATNGIDGKVNTTATFALSLNGGSLRTPFIQVAAWQAGALFNWNGGTVVATAPTNNFITLYMGNNVLVGNGGAILDTAGYDIGIGINLVANGSGGLTKLGAGTLTLSGANTYTGDTTVERGTLAITQPVLATTAKVSINSGAVLRLDFSGTNAIDGLILGGVTMPPGLYNASTTPAQIAGSGSLLIGGTLPRNLVWDNGAGTGNWNTTDPNWTGLIWDNTRPDNASFKAIGGDIALTESITGGSVTFGSVSVNCPNSTFIGGSLKANSLTVQGSSGNGPSTSVNRLNVNVPTVSILGDVAVGRGTLAIGDGNFTAGRIISAPESADWGTLIISGGTVMATNGIDGSVNTTATFAFNLNGGTLRTPFIKVADRNLGPGAGNAFFTWDGGTVVATAPTDNLVTRSSTKARWWLAPRRRASAT
ncbi:MAG: autotransporter-associated beta strand repeat-containing protein, partial [Verrucomicrobia bacterium]|nr:autotransporter-associated beta strand repeat-containing protein [Verrucomicrobiota bacterium]